MTLDDVLAGRRIDVAKIDVEGAESLVLDGARETLARSSGATLFVECHPAALQRLGTSATDWLAALHDGGSVELIDESRRRLLPATEGPVSRVPDDHAFNVRWTLS